MVLITYANGCRKLDYATLIMVIKKHCNYCYSVFFNIIHCHLLQHYPHHCDFLVDLFQPYLRFVQLFR